MSTGTHRERVAVERMAGAGFDERDDPLAPFMLLVMVAAPAVAQRPDSGTVRVTVEESMGMSGGFRVQSAGKTAVTDQEGVARLILPSGRHDIAITRVGFNPASVTVTVRDAVTELEPSDTV